MMSLPDIQEFCHEILLWSTLHHKNILPLLGVVLLPEQDMIGAVSPWMENASLSSYLEESFPKLTDERKDQLVSILGSISARHN
jgi:serine/threonine protein kinase